MRSMTGYGRAAGKFDRFEIVVQVSSVNKRNLDLSILLPDQWQELEAGFLERVRRDVLRGKVQVTVEIETGGVQPDRLWDEQTLAATLDRLADFAAKRKIAFAPDAALLWQLASSQRAVFRLPDPGAVRPVATEALEEALAGFLEMRGKEGEALRADLAERARTVRRLLAEVREEAPLVMEHHREALHQRLKQAGLDVDPDDERVLKELALFADRSDISEELTRLSSHFDQLAELFEAAGEIGRKADFIVQEIGRELHTVGSKANAVTIARRVIECKNEMERIREQVQNVE